jgi:uncharacterized protein Usg
MFTHESLHKQLEGYRLTTAEILYHLPDHPHLVQSFIWQQIDIAPRYPELQRFLAFWEKNIEGKLHSVKVAQAALIGPPRMNYGQVSLSLH